MQTQTSIARRKPGVTTGPGRLKPLSLFMALALPTLAWAQQAQQTQQAPIQASPQQPAAADASGTQTTLPAVRVEAASQSDVTEGTGAYSARASNTSTPLSMSLRETPQAVSVITQQRMTDQRLQTITDVLNSTPGVSVNQYETSRAQFNARGFNINSLLIDGVPTRWDQPWSSGEIFSSLAMYDRVEVVRGATGLMTGTGQPSAAINMLRKRASSPVFTGSVELELGSWKHRRGLVDLSTPLNAPKTVRARVVGEYSQRDSFVRNQERENQTFFATIEADLTERTLLTAGASRQQNDSRGPMWGALPVWYSNGMRTNFDRSTSTAANWTRWDTTYRTYFASLEHRFSNDWKLKASYTRGVRTADSYLLYMSGSPNLFTGAGMSAMPGSDDVKTTQDDYSLQGSGNFQWFGREHEAAFGYVNSRQAFNAKDREATPGTGPVRDFRLWNGMQLEPYWAPARYYGDGVTRQEAAYGVARFSLADPLKLIVGARVTNYRKTTNERNAAPKTLNVRREVTPYAGLIYDISKEVSAFASYTSIFEPQSVRNASGQYLDPIKGQAFETGLKAEFLDGRLNASASAFRIKQKNIGVATNQTIPGPGGLPETVYRASDGALSTGFDLELTGELARGWNLGAGYTQFRAKEKNGKDFNPIYPRKLLRLFSTYRLPGDWSGLTLGGGLSWQSDIYVRTSRGPLRVEQTISQGSYALVDLMARYEFNDRLSAQLNVKNAANKKYFNISGNFAQINYGEPRSVNVSMKYRF